MLFEVVKSVEIVRSLGKTSAILPFILFYLIFIFMENTILLLPSFTYIYPEAIFFID